MARRGAMGAVFTACGIALLLQAAGADEPVPAKPVPGLLDLGKVKLEIVSATFVRELKGNNASYAETRPEKFRGMIATLKVQKPAGAELTLNAPDLVLHYTYGAKADVARCYGLSGFSTMLEVDRPMNLFIHGSGGVSTGVSTIRASVVYVDAFFQHMEPDTAELHLLVAQPAGAFFKTDGWK